MSPNNKYAKSYRTQMGSSESVVAELKKPTFDFGSMKRIPNMSFCETCRTPKPRARNEKVTKGWKCGDCRKVSA